MEYHLTYLQAAGLQTPLTEYQSVRLLLSAKFARSLAIKESTVRNEAKRLGHLHARLLPLSPINMDIGKNKRRFFQYDLSSLKTL